MTLVGGDDIAVEIGRSAHVFTNGLIGLTVNTDSQFTEEGGD